MTHEPRTWRELLGQWIDDPQQCQRIASALGINSITLRRWVKQKSNPRPENLRRLLQVLPQQRDRFLALLEAEGIDFSALTEEDEHPTLSSGIPSELYIRVLHTRSSIPKALFFSSLCDLILQQALEQLDPDRLGMAIIVARCMPPSADHQVHSLRESAGRGTPPWAPYLEQQALLLGIESLAGNAVITGHLVSNQHLSTNPSLAPGYQDAKEESAVAAPIMFMGNIAGSLLVSSTQRDYFVPVRCQLIEYYAELLALAFDPHDFCEPADIDLGVVPPPQIQREYMSTFRQRVFKIMTERAREGKPGTLSQAEQLVWQQLEEELLQSWLSGANTSVENHQEV